MQPTNETSNVRNVWRLLCIVKWELRKIQASDEIWTHDTSWSRTDAPTTELQETLWWSMVPNILQGFLTLLTQIIMMMIIITLIMITTLLLIIKILIMIIIVMIMVIIIVVLVYCYRSNVPTDLCEQVTCWGFWLLLFRDNKFFSVHVPYAGYPTISSL